jgi:hypothetical protein
MSRSPKKTPRVDDRTMNAMVLRQQGQRRLKKATTLTIASAITVTMIATALASNVPMKHSRASTVSIASSPAAIAAAQQAAAATNSSASTSSSAPTYSQSAPVASSGGS